jgi:hypothetical protein
LPETYHVLWEDGDSGDFYGEQQYNDAAQLFTMNKKKFRRPESKKYPGRVYIEDYEITFKSKWFMKACQLYGNPTDVIASYVERFIILGLIKFLHELFHSFTDFILDLEWFYTQRMNTNIILRYPRTPPRVGVHICNTKHKLIMGDLGYAFEGIIFGNHKRLKVAMMNVEWVPTLVLFEVGEVRILSEDDGDQAKIKQQTTSSSSVQLTKSHTRTSYVKKNSSQTKISKGISALKGRNSSGKYGMNEDKGKGKALETAIVTHEKFRDLNTEKRYISDVSNSIVALSVDCSYAKAAKFLLSLQVEDESLMIMNEIEPVQRTLSKKDKSRRFSAGFSGEELFGEELLNLHFHEDNVAEIPIDPHGRTIKP